MAYIILHGVSWFATASVASVLIGPQQPAMVHNWIFGENLKPFLETLAAFVHYSFDDADWIAIEFGIRGTDVERGNWFEYDLIGDSPIRVQIARDIGTSVVFIAAQTPGDIASKVSAAIEIMQGYHLK